MASIKIHTNHTHTLQTAETLRFLPADNNQKNTFIEYFNNGMGLLNLLSTMKIYYHYDMISSNKIMPMVH